MKKILNFAVAISAVISLGTFTSCEDMFTAENNLVSTNIAPQDTLFNVMGIIQRMQKLATRTVLLGEARADLVMTNSFTPANIKELAENNVSLGNEYNKPEDYYDVINNCNVFLANVDTARRTHGDQYFEKDIVAVKTFRAWAYLELAKIYGNVPFITTPLLSASDVNAAINGGAARKDMNGICSYFIDELLPYSKMAKNDEFIPSYGVAKNDKDKNFIPYEYFIPVRVMLAELYLWRGSFTKSKEDYVNAARFYHDYLAYPNEEMPISDYSVVWSNTTFKSYSDSYSSWFQRSNYLGCIPLDTLSYLGNTSNLKEIFCSTYKNKYYAFLNPSTRVKEISRAQWPVCQLTAVTSGGVTYLTTDYAPHHESMFSNSDRLGDLRYTSNVSNTYYTNKGYSDYNNNRQIIYKYSTEADGTFDNSRIPAVSLFRPTIIYLHMAEALNRAGFPYTAFDVLTVGLSSQVLGNKELLLEKPEPTNKNGIFDIMLSGKSYQIPMYEYNELRKIKSYGFSASFIDWDDDEFDNMVETRNSAETPTHRGIHTLGCGEVYYYDLHYRLPINDSVRVAACGKEYAAYFSADSAYAKWKKDNPVLNDSLARIDKTMSQKVANLKAEYYKADSLQYAAEFPMMQDYVAQRILDEEAIEGMFEGTRFYDLMRFNKYYQGQSMRQFDMDNCEYVGPGTIIDEHYLSNQISKRGSEGVQSKSITEAKGWYLPLK